MVSKGDPSPIQRGLHLDLANRECLRRSLTIVRPDQQKLVTRLKVGCAAL